MNYRRTSDSGVALIVVLLAMLFFTIMMLGFYFVTTGEQKIAASDRDNAVAYHGAQGALEKMSSDLAAFFVSHVSPTPAQVTSLTGAAYLPSIPGITFPTGGYTIGQPPTGTMGGSLTSTVGTIQGNGPLQGLQGIITPFTLTVIADGPNNTEVKMTRQVQEVAVPVFQFGIFSDSDLSFFAGPDFGFGGRVHTNGNLFLAEDGGTLTLGDRTTAYKDVIRAQLSNGLLIFTGSGASAGNGYTTTVDQITTSGGCPGTATTCRAMAWNEGSVTGGPGSPVNPNWNTLSLTTYNGWIRSGKTGAKKLNLALALAGSSPIAMIQRPITVPPGPFEDPLGIIGHDRFFNQASLRILLSDQTSSITNLPAIDATAQPYPLAEGASSGMSNVIQRASSSNAYYLPAADACHPPIAQSPGYAADNDYMLKSGTTLLGGYIKIEMQLNSSPGTWRDVTKEILSLGISQDVVTPIAAPVLSAGSSGGSLTSGTTYYYTVTALGPWGETVGTEASRAATSSKKITVSWATAYPTGYPGATGYRVYRTKTSGNYTGTGNGYIPLTVGTAGTGWASPWTSYTDSGATTPTAGSPPAPPACTNISILHLEEAKPGVGLNSTTQATTATNFVPINMYDPREGEVRDSNSYTTVSLNGVINIIEVDVKNLQKWFANMLCTGSTVPTSCPSGALALNNSGYILYFSDRRGNNNGGSETGEYGYEDTINSSSGTGSPNGNLDAGEDVNGNLQLDTYGGIAHPINSANVDSSGSSKYPTGSTTTLTQFMSSLTNPTTPNSAPLTRITSSATGVGYYEAQKNPVLFFRRALRLVNGGLGNLPPLAAATAANCPGALGGFTVAAENPIYVQGDYNATSTLPSTGSPAGFNDITTGTGSPACHVPAAVIGDAVTLLSNDWTDSVTLANPTARSSRPQTTQNAWYRTAIIGGKNNSFPLPTFTTPAAPPKDFGTDGGTHNFLRYIENWNTTLNYRGSMVSFYIASQGTGVYKCCSTVYNPPTRAYAFDTDFSNIQKLPPGTPRFTDVNALSFQQAILSTQ